MKRLLIILLRCIVLFLLLLYGYETITWKQLQGSWVRAFLDNFSFWVNRFVTWVSSGWLVVSGSNETWVTFDSSGSLEDQIKPTSWRKLVLQTARPSDGDLTTVQRDIQRNKEFLTNLLQNSKQLYPAVGKWDIYVKRTQSSNFINDRIDVTSSSGSTFFPAKYNADNAFLIKNGQSHAVYQATGLQLLDNQKGEYYVYYPALSSDGGMKGTLVWLKQGNGLIIPDLVPLLYYKQQYFFTTQTLYGHQWLRVATNNELAKLGDRSIGWIAIDNDLFAFHDRWLNTLYLINLSWLDITHSIDMPRPDITLQWVVKGSWDVLWVEYTDNQTQQTLYEQWRYE